MKMIRYEKPKRWIEYDLSSLSNIIIRSRVSIEKLKDSPYQREWVKDLQEIELKREIAGTSRIEGADFTERELEEALKESPEELLTRSQRQAHAAAQTYRWISQLPVDKPINRELILEMHRRMITGADDDHCEPGALRKQDQNVIFGTPRHRGAEGGQECSAALDALIKAINSEFKDHEPIIQAIAAHYHLASIHPFLDGNGRTARGLEALMLQRAGLRDICFIPMSNFYYEEKQEYLKSLSSAGNLNHDLTPFIHFALKGVELQSKRIFKEIQTRISKALFRNLMYDLFGRLKSPRKRVIAERQIEILKILLDKDSLNLIQLIGFASSIYSKLKNPMKGLIRDLEGLLKLGALSYQGEGEDDFEKIILRINLDWPKEISESEFLQRIKTFPKSKTHSFLGR